MEFKRTLSNISEAEFHIIKELCYELNITVADKSLNVKPNSKLNYLSRKEIEITMRIDLVSSDLISLEYLGYLMEKRKNSVDYLESCITK